MKQAFAYLRVSGRGQINGDGFERQRTAINSFARNHRSQVVGEFRDEGVSGATETMERPGLVELLDVAPSKGVDLMIVENSTRLARDLIVGELILQECRQRGVTVKDADGTDLTNSEGNPSSTLVRQVFLAVAEFEKTQLVQRLRVARQRKKKTTGRCEGRKPYGLGLGEREVCLRISRLRRRGLSFSKIANQLNQEQVPSPSGGEWSRQTVRNVWGRV
jgi:DNA invertase Pin-like site-specific DNA recombinase